MTASPERKTPTAERTTAMYTEQLLAGAANNPIQSPKANAWSADPAAARTQPVVGLATSDSWTRAIGRKDGAVKRQRVEKKKKDGGERLGGRVACTVRPPVFAAADL
ncbi:hypothetical protein ON010_g2507 [Phytophthora cinnamomi]|nr:hypothetical protein ON010_g2507 [Phytophthora cinnamomi]